LRAAEVLRAAEGTDERLGVDAPGHAAAKKPSVASARSERVSVEEKCHGLYVS
jgi:hypothetical protein